jgi:hypothetical protein
MQTAAFQSFFWVGPHASGSLSIGVDDAAQVYIDDLLVGGTGSVSSFQAASQGENVAATLDLTTALQDRVPNGGGFMVTVIAQNGPSSFGTACPAQGCDYSENPAGVILYGTITW